MGIEGTGVYGAGLARHLHTAGVAMVEIDRPDRKARRWQGKSDPVDAEAAARAALAAHRTGTPKRRTGQVEALRNLRVARRSAIDQRADVQRQLKSLLVTAPEPLRSQLRGLPTGKLIVACAAARPDPGQAADPATATRIALRALARRHQHLCTELAELDKMIIPLVRAVNPTLYALPGVGPDVAGQLLVTIGDNADRMHSEAAFAMLCGVAPLPASSGKTTRHRLNRGGDRQAKPCPVARRHDPDGPRHPYPYIRATANPRRHEQERDHSMPETLRRPRALPLPPTRQPRKGS